MLPKVQPNKRLKLTEPAVDESGARESTSTQVNNRYFRAAWYILMASACRSLAAIR